MGFGALVSVWGGRSSKAWPRFSEGDLSALGTFWRACCSGHPWELDKRKNKYWNGQVRLGHLKKFRRKIPSRILRQLNNISRAGQRSSELPWGQELLNWTAKIQRKMENSAFFDPRLCTSYLFHPIYPLPATHPLGPAPPAWRHFSAVYLLPHRPPLL